MLSKLCAADNSYEAAKPSQPPMTTREGSIGKAREARGERPRNRRRSRRGREAKPQRRRRNWWSIRPRPLLPARPPHCGAEASLRLALPREGLPFARKGRRSHSRTRTRMFRPLDRDFVRGESSSSSSRTG